MGSCSFVACLRNQFQHWPCMLLEMKGGGGILFKAFVVVLSLFFIRRMVGSSMQREKAWVAPVLQSQLFGGTPESRGKVQQKIIWSSHALEKGGRGMHTTVNDRMQVFLSEEGPQLAPP